VVKAEDKDQESKKKLKADPVVLPKEKISDDIRFVSDNYFSS
jgi:hypothetical protein